MSEDFLLPCEIAYYEQLTCIAAAAHIGKKL